MHCTLDTVSVLAWIVLKLLHFFHSLHRNSLKAKRSFEGQGNLIFGAPSLIVGLGKLPGCFKNNEEAVARCGVLQQ